MTSNLELNTWHRNALYIRHIAVLLLVFYTFLIHPNPKGPHVLPFITLVLSYNENLLGY